jgi:hypothetical protein
MPIVAALRRLASAASVFFGPQGAVSAQARDRGVSRQALYREAEHALGALDGSDTQRQIHDLQEQVNHLRERLRQSEQRLRHQQSYTVLLDPDKQAEFASVAQAEGVSLPAVRVLLSALLQRAPSVAKLGRATRQAGLLAAPLLNVLDEHARARVKQANGDEIFFGVKPVLMTVEPASQCWVGGRLSDKRDAQQWQKEIAALPALEHFVRDGGKGLKSGLARVNQQRRKAKRAAIGDQLDHFHTLREGKRALRKAQGKVTRACEKAEKADKKVARQDRQGQSLAGYQTSATIKWQKAEEAFQEWSVSEEALSQIQEALRPFTPEGELNTRERAEERVRGLLGQLKGQEWAKFKRAAQQPETYTYLDRLNKEIAGLRISAEVREAVVGSEGIRQRPELVRGEGEKARGLRGLLVVWGVVIHLGGEGARHAAQAVRRLLSSCGRASSAVEGVNSVLRMQQGRHRKMTQGLLDLKRLYWNLRPFRTGKRKGKSPYQLLGVRLPPDLSWWQLLHLSPDELRKRLSAQPAPQ